MSVSVFSPSFVPMNSNFGQSPFINTAHPNVMSPVIKGPRGRGAVNDRIGMAGKNRLAVNLPGSPRAPQPSKRSRRQKQREASGLDRSHQLTTQPLGMAELHETGPRKKQKRNRPRQAMGDVDVEMADVPEITQVVKSREVVMRDAPPLNAPQALPPVVVNFKKRDGEMRDVPMRDAPPLAPLRPLRPVFVNFKKMDREMRNVVMRDAPPLVPPPRALRPVIVNFKKMDREMRNVVMGDAPPLRDAQDILATAFERLQVAQEACDRDGDIIMADAPLLGV